MNIALIAHDKKKDLMVEFCVAYSAVLKKHTLYATGTTGSVLIDATKLPIEKFLAGSQGGIEQISSRIAFNEIDMLIFFQDPVSPGPNEPKAAPVFRLCDLHNIPLATNLATAEVLVRALDKGDLGWRDIVNPKQKRN
jgi:methylglyoxal synthase